MGDAIARKRSSNEKTEKEPHRRVQGESRGSGIEGRQDAGRTGGEVRCSRRRPPVFSSTGLWSPRLIYPISG